LMELNHDDVYKDSVTSTVNPCFATFGPYKSV
jgi:hypothetical protein